MSATSRVIAIVLVVAAQALALMDAQPADSQHHQQPPAVPVPELSTIYQVL